ncbi:hypothetical protein ACFZB9_18430 [Kitasatospora sp. NPDC008050]|uniref:hypothetical protein n=1 Tax=Kitasatospora sp. NPDC008050 TaxID=3364021 RepID=UPI0036E1AD94
MPWYEGSCRITVIGVAASWPQRAVVSIRRGATIVIPGIVGAGEVIDGSVASHGWDLSVEHQYEGVWRPNVRAIQGKWTDSEHGRSQLIRSKDHDWPGDTSERNLVIRIDRVGSGVPAPGVVAGARRSGVERVAAPVVGQQTTARRAVTESVPAATPVREQIPARWSGTGSTSAPMSNPVREQGRSGARWGATESSSVPEPSPASARRAVTESTAAPERTQSAAPRVATQGYAAPAIPRVTTSGGSSA